MGRDVLSVRQIMVLLVTALLAPLIDLLPVLTARTVGGGGWLVVLGALPLLLTALWATKKSRSFKGTARCIINIMYLLWIPLVLSMFLRLSEDRLEMIYGAGRGTVFTAVLLLIAVWMAVGKVSAFARAAEIFYLLLAVVLAGLLLLAVFKVEWGNLAVAGEELASIPTGSAMVAGIILNVYPVAVLKDKAVPQAGDRGKAVGWVVAFCGVIALGVAAVVGCLGPVLTTKVSSPFLIMVQGLGVKGAFQRTEALIAALWVVSDLTLIGALLHAWRELACEVYSGKWCRWSVIPIAVAALGVAWFLIPEGADDMYSMVLPAGGLFFGLLLPVILRVVGSFLKKDH